MQICKLGFDLGERCLTRCIGILGGRESINKKQRVNTRIPEYQNTRKGWEGLVGKKACLRTVRNGLLGEGKI